MKDNVMLWFARNESGEIVTIDEVDKTENEKYYCALCGGELIPRQGEIMSWHFAHMDKSKCSGESMAHFWVKNKLLEIGDVFSIISDKERTFVCKEILVEKEYKVGDKKYRPDLTIITECGETIFFEMDYSNKKKIEDYFGIWVELEKIVVEIDVNQLLECERKISKFKAKYYKGKCFNVKKKDRKFIDVFEKFINKSSNNNDYSTRKKYACKFSWLWKDILNYKRGVLKIEDIYDELSCIFDNLDYKKAIIILKSQNCVNIYKDYLSYKHDKMLNDIKKEIANNIMGDYTIKERTNYTCYNGESYESKNFEVSNEFNNNRIILKWNEKDYIKILKSFIAKEKEKIQYYDKHRDVCNLIVNKYKTIDDIFVKLRISDGIDKYYTIEFRGLYKTKSLYFEFCKDKIIYDSGCKIIIFEDISNIQNTLAWIDTVLKPVFKHKAKQDERDEIKRIKHLKNEAKELLEEKFNYFMKKDFYNNIIKPNFKKILKNSKDVVSYSINFPSNICTEDSFIFFKDTCNQENIIVIEEDYKIVEKYFPDKKVIMIDEWIDVEDYKNLIICKTEYGYNIGDIDYYKEGNFNICKYKYNGILSKYKFNLFYKPNKYNKIKKDIRYKFLKDFDFVFCTKEISKLKSEILDFKKLQNKLYADNFNKKDIFKMDNIEIYSEEIDEKIDSILKSMIYAIKNISNSKDVNLMVSPKYTKQDDRFKLWLLDDFIDECIYTLGINTINNAMKEYYI